MRRILITGGEGYIGKNLSKFLYKYGGTHIICDISDYGRHNKSLAQDLTLEEIEKYDGIVHLAALSGIVACEENYLEAIEKNFLTAQNVFSKASSKKIPVVFTSSQAAKDPSSSRYANLKYQCEMLAELYNKKLNGMNYVIRLSNVYGGDHYLEKKQTCVKQFVTRYQDDLPFLVHGDGKQIRDFIHVNDVCNAIMLLLDRKPMDKSPMDIGTGIGTSIMDLVKMFPSRKNHFTLLESRSAGTDSSIADISVAKKRIGFVAERKLEDYIKRSNK